MKDMVKKVISTIVNNIRMSDSGYYYINYKELADIFDAETTRGYEKLTASIDLNLSRIINMRPEIFSLYGITTDGVVPLYNGKVISYDGY